MSPNFLTHSEIKASNNQHVVDYFNKLLKQLLRVHPLTATSAWHRLEGLKVNARDVTFRLEVIEHFYLLTHNRDKHL